MSDYATLFQDLLGSALASVIERIQMAEYLVAEADREDAWHLLSYSLKEPHRWEETRQLLLVLIPKMEQAGFREEWIAYLQAGVESGNQHHDLPAVAEFELQIALLYRMLSHYAQAVQWLQSGLQHFKTLNDRRGQARVLNEWAWVEQLRRNFDEATCHVEAALRLLSDDDPERGMCYRVQGMIAIYQGRWEEAERLHRKALAIFEQNRDMRKTAWCMVNTGLAMNGQKQFDQAIDLYLNASTIFENIGDIYNRLIAQINIASTYFNLDKISSAIEWYLKAEKIAHQLKDRRRLGDIAVGLGLTYLSSHENENASHWFHYSMIQFRDLNIPSLMVNAMDGLGMSYIVRHMYKEAIEVLENAITILPQIANVPNYDYYSTSLYDHLAQAKQHQELSFEFRADIV